MPAAQTIAFTTTDDDFSFTINGISAGTWDRVEELDARHRIDVTDNEIVVALNNGTYFSFTIYNTDTVTIDSVEFEGTIRELYDELKDEVFFVASGGASEVVIYELITTITDAQIKALPTTPITILNAPPSGSAHIFHSAHLFLKSVADYTNIAANAAMSVSQLTGFGPDRISTELLNDPDFRVSNLFALGDLSATASVTRDITHALFEDADEWKLYLNNQGSGDLTGGNASNELIISVYYSIIEY